MQGSTRSRNAASAVDLESFVALGVRMAAGIVAVSTTFTGDEIGGSMGRNRVAVGNTGALNAAMVS